MRLFYHREQRGSNALQNINFLLCASEHTNTPPSAAINFTLTQTRSHRETEKALRHRLGEWITNLYRISKARNDRKYSGGFMAEWISEFGWDRLSNAKPEAANQCELYDTISPNIGKRVNVSFLTYDLWLRSVYVGAPPWRLCIFWIRYSIDIHVSSKGWNRILSHEIVAYDSANSELTTNSECLSRPVCSVTYCRKWNPKTRWPIKGYVWRVRGEELSLNHAVSQRLLVARFRKF